MTTLDQIPPQKKTECSYIGRQFLRWNKYWIKCKDPKKRDQYMKQAAKLGEMLEAELLSKQYE